MEMDVIGSWGNDSAVTSLIEHFIPHNVMRALLYNCLRVDILDNNDKARIVAEILGPTFKEIGTGTNRIALLHNGMIVKVALDRRGLADNATEFKRSAELENFLAKTYETNYLINICEYVELLEMNEFIIQEDSIKRMLAEIAKNYIFEDIGFSEKNACNWGMRDAHLTEEEMELYGENADFVKDVCILDYGYLYPLGDQKDKLMRCPKCKHKLSWNRNYTALMCTNSGSCGFQTAPMNLRRMMRLDMEDLENRLIGEFNNMKMPNLDNIEHEIQKIHKNIGGNE